MLSELLISPNFGVHIKYSVPTIEVIEITTEKGFATSNPSGPVSPMSYDDSYMDESDEA